MRGDPVVLGDENLMRPECRAQVIGLIRASTVPNGRKRAIYLRWLLAVGVPYHAADLDEVITSWPHAAPTAEELR